MSVPIIGIDEVGRGCLAGPLCIAAVLLLQPIPGLNDSKKLSAKNRQLLACEIKRHGWVGLGWVSAAEIDDIGMGKALRLGAERALADHPPDIAAHAKIIIDGSINLLPGRDNVETLVKADTTVQEVMAASIAAKVARDAVMAAYDTVFPVFKFASNKGYGTAEHMAALFTHDGSTLHRHSFAPLSTKQARLP